VFKQRQRPVQNEGRDFILQVLLAFFGFWVVNKEFK
jgi:hypothetical protein